jgi:hypothetical protein
MGAEGFTAVDYSTARKASAVAGRGLAASLIDQDTDAALFTLGEAGYGEPRVRFSPDGRLLAVGVDYTVTLFETASGRMTARIDLPSTLTGDLAFRPDGSRLLACCADGSAVVLDVGRGVVEKALKRETYRSTTAAFFTSGEGPRVLAGGAVMARGQARTMFVVSAGVNEYPWIGNLRLAVKDAQDFGANLERVAAGSFWRVDRRILLDSAVSVASLKAAFADVAARAQPQDTFVFSTRVSARRGRRLALPRAPPSRS